MQPFTFAFLSLVIMVVSYWVIAPLWVKKYETVTMDRLSPYVKEGFPRVTFRVKSSPRVNAFSLPGGTILMTSALLAQREHEISAALAHELGHIAKRHHLKSFTVTATLVPSAILILAYLGLLPGIAFTISGFLFQRYLSRRFEFEADSYAVSMVGKDSYYALLMKYGNEEGGSSVLSAHPTVLERLKKI